MKIKRIKLENFTAFENTTIQFSDGLNVIIGENGTGKTHLMKVIYAASQATRKDVSFAQKLVRTMMPDDYKLSRLSSKGGKGKPTKISVSAVNDCAVMKNITINFDKKTNKWDANIKGELGWENEFASANSIFIPAKEILSNSYQLTAAVSKNNVMFDDTYIDILNSAKVDVSNGTDQTQTKMLRALETIIGGKVEYNIKKDSFYIKNGNSKQEFTLVSEGIRKIALLWQLIKFGYLVSGSILLWDEPEANINPQYMGVIADILLELQRNDVQIFVATHDYFLGKYIDARKKANDKIEFYSLSKTNGILECESSAEFSLLETNKILDAARILYREEIGIGDNKI